MGRDYRKLHFFQKSYDLLLEIYTILPLFPESESRNLTDQLRRSATSIVLNIVEGASHGSEKVFLSHLRYSYGSLKEVQVILSISHDLMFIQSDLYYNINKFVDDVGGSLYNFIRKVEFKDEKFDDKFSF